MGFLNSVMDLANSYRCSLWAVQTWVANSASSPPGFEPVELAGVIFLP